jgi:uncharacterized protein YjbI with pentapeptide repeats
MNQKKSVSAHHRQQQATKSPSSPKPSKPSPTQPAPDDREGWKAYWGVHQQPWRTEPEIDQQRQAELEQCRAIHPDIEEGIYPFKGIKLNRADVEWLLATHEHGKGPVYWTSAHAQRREGLDLRGADVRQADLQELPLACIRGGLTMAEWYDVAQEKRIMAEKEAAVCMEGVQLERAHLEEACLRGAQLQNAILRRTHLEEADLGWSQLQQANLVEAHLERASLYGADLEGAVLDGANLEEAQLTRSTLINEKHIGPQLVDVRWDGVNLALMGWSRVIMLGNEYKAHQRRQNGKKKDRTMRDGEYRRAIRANRQLALALQAQGLNEDAARFAYRAQRLQRIVLRRRRKFISYLFSLFLDLLAGYGYRPGRSFLIYLFVIGGFATLYSLFGHFPLLPDALVFSLMSFHGRGFFPSLNGETSLHNPLVVFAAAEAVVGLFVEISFIATFTQRFFGR